MYLTSTSPLIKHNSPISSIIQKTSTTSPFPKYLSSLCFLWEKTHHTDLKNSHMPNICHEYTSPDKLLTGDVAPPRQYTFAEVVSDMLQGSSDNRPISVLHDAQDVGRNIGLVGIGLFLLALLMLVAIIACIKRRKNIQTELPQELRNTPIVLILERLNTSRSKDIPPDYSSVVQMKKQEEEDLPCPPG